MALEKPAQKFHADDASLPDLDGACDNIYQSKALHRSGQWQTRLVISMVFTLVSQTSLLGEPVRPSGDVTKSRLFSRANSWYLILRYKITLRQMFLADCCISRQNLFSNFKVP